MIILVIGIRQMSEQRYADDKPRDCRYCYFWNESSEVCERQTCYYLLPEEENGEIPLAFRADFHSRGEKYFLIKPAKIWSNETNEYVFVYSAPWFDREMIDRCVQYALDTALPLIHPHAEHNYSNVHTVFVADTVSEEVRRHIRKVRFSKSYRMNLHGFTILKAGWIDLQSSAYGTNRDGHDMNKFFKELFTDRH